MPNLLPRPAIFATAAFLLAVCGSCPTVAQAHAEAHAVAPCSLATPDQIKALAGTPVLPGKPGASDCTWVDGKGVTRVYISVKDAADFKEFRASMQATGRMLPISGLAEDAFFVSSAANSTVLFALKAHHLLSITVDGVGLSKAENQAAEKSLAGTVLAKL